MNKRTEELCRDLQYGFCLGAFVGRVRAKSVLKYLGVKKLDEMLARRVKVCGFIVSPRKGGYWQITHEMTMRHEVRKLEETLDCVEATYRKLDNDIRTVWADDPWITYG